MARGQGITVVILIVVLIGGAIGLNYMQHFNAPTEEEVQQQQRDAMQKAASAQAKAPTPPPAMPAPNRQSPPKPVASSASRVAPSDEIMGSPANKNIVALGYTVDSETAANPGALLQVTNTLESWSKANPKYTIKIVCLDLPQSQLSNPADQNLPLGLSVNGQPIGGCDTNPGQGIFTAGLLQTVLTAVK